MNTQPQNIYKYTPDVLDLVIDESCLPDYRIFQTETAFGKDERKYVYFSGILLGELIEAPEYYKGLKVAIGKKLTMSLAPTMSKSQNLELPEIKLFKRVLLDLLENEKGWSLICERDCEQEEVKRYSSNVPKANELLSDLFDFIENGKNACPTFLLKS